MLCRHDIMTSDITGLYDYTFNLYFSLFVLCSVKCKYLIPFRKLTLKQFWWDCFHLLMWIAFCVLKRYLVVPQNLHICVYIRSVGVDLNGIYIWCTIIYCLVILLSQHVLFNALIRVLISTDFFDNLSLWQGSRGLIMKTWVKYEITWDMWCILNIRFVWSIYEIKVECHCCLDNYALVDPGGIPDVRPMRVLILSV